MKKNPDVSSPRAETSKQTEVASAKHRSLHVGSGSVGHGKRASAGDTAAAQPSGQSRSEVSSPDIGLKRVRFGYFNPDAREVFVAGSFNSWNPRATPMSKDALGDWSVELRLPPGEYRYRFLVDGDWHDDPLAQLTAINAFGSFDAVVSV